MLDLHFSLCKCKGGRGKVLLQAKAACEPFRTPVPARGAGGGAATAPSSCEHARDCVLGARGSAYLPSACLASHGLHGIAKSCTQPARLAAASPGFGGELGGSQPATHFLAFLKGCYSFPAPVWSFGKQLSSPQVVLAARRCQRRGSARCTQHLLDLFNRKLTSGKKDWLACLVQGRRAAQPLCGSQKRGVGLVSGHAVLLSDAGQVTVLPCWPACAAGTSVSAGLTAL